MNPFHPFPTSNSLIPMPNTLGFPPTGGSNLLPTLDSIRHGFGLLTSLVPANPMLYSVLNENLNQLQQGFQTQQMQLNELKLRHQVEGMRAEKEITRLKVEFENAQQKIVQSASARLDAEKIRYFEVEISQLNTKLKERDRKIEDLKTANQKLSLEVEHSAKIIAELRDDLAVEEAKLTRLRVENDSKDRSLMEMEAQLGALQQQLDYRSTMEYDFDVSAQLQAKIQECADLQRRLTELQPIIQYAEKSITDNKAAEELRQLRRVNEEVLSENRRLNTVEIEK